MVLPTIYDGSGQQPAERMALHAGAFSAIFENGALRYIRLGDHEILRGIYAAVRDHNWGTVPATRHIHTLDIRADSFDIQFVSEHHQDDVHFVWEGAITGGEDGTMRFRFDGKSLTSFKRNRIGFCVLHPVTLAGASCTLVHVDGHSEACVFPAQIAPFQPFLDIRAITHTILPGLRVEVRMEGDTFETEDQRNWTDASYKTYCTPLGDPFPVQLAAGAEIHQSVTVRLLGHPPEIRVDERRLTLRVDPQVARPLPAIGLGMSTIAETLIPREIERLKVLHLAHLRLDMHVDVNSESTLQRATETVRALSCKLELAVHLGDNSAAELGRARSIVDALGTPLTRWLILREGANATPRETVVLARHLLAASEIPIAAGTNGFFTQINRERPPSDLVDWVVYALSPQVHAFDNASLVETFLTQTTTVESARAFSLGRQIAVSPVTLKVRWNPASTVDDAPLPLDILPRQVDARQMSLFGAAWTLGSLKALAVADSVTYFETVGWLGVMESEMGSPLPVLFPSFPGGVFPMYHVFAAVGDFAEGEVLRSVSSDPLLFDGLLLRHGEKIRILLANYTQERHSITLTGLNRRFAVRSLDETNAEIAMREPESFRASPGITVEAVNASLDIELLPYALVCLDALV